MEVRRRVGRRAEVSPCAAAAGLIARAGLPVIDRVVGQAGMRDRGGRARQDRRARVGRHAGEVGDVSEAELDLEPQRVAGVGIGD